MITNVNKKPTLASYRLPFILTAAAASVAYLFFLVRLDQPANLFITFSGYLALGLSWGVSSLMIYYAEKKDSYLLFLGGILAYALISLSSVLVIGLKELSSGIPGISSFILISATVFPVMLVVLHMIFDWRQYRE